MAYFKSPTKRRRLSPDSPNFEMTKWECRRRHVENRARDRFDLDISEVDIRMMERDIQIGCSILLASREDNDLAQLHQVRCRGKTLYAVYNSRREYIKTVLHEEYARGAWTF
jgi:hypothetical protein